LLSWTSLKEGQAEKRWNMSRILDHWVRMRVKMMVGWLAIHDTHHKDFS
jgi:hypothetical protein